MDAYSMSVASASHKSTSRIYQDLKSSRLHTVSSFSFDKLSSRLGIMTTSSKSGTMESSKKPHVGIVGAGMAGLRSAGYLLELGFQVTILEARDRLGGRIYQEKLPNGHFVDMGANWIHGTKENSIFQLAKETGTITTNWDGDAAVFDEHGQMLPTKDGERFSTIMWNIIAEAFQYSDKHSAEIDASRSLLDFFKEKVVEQIPETEEDYARKRDIVLQMAELWGAFVGSPVEKQSLKFFWLEECLDGENLFCSGTYRKIMEQIAAPVVDGGADIKLQTRVTEIFGKSHTGSNTVKVKTTNNQIYEFDELILTTPLGWLKQNLHAFHPPLPPRLTSAIQSIGYGCLEKVYISFPKAFWLEHDSSQGDDRTVRGFCQWLSPSYAPSTNPSRWTNEIVELGSIDPSVAHPTLLFYIYGAESEYVTSKVRSLSSGTSKGSTEAAQFLYEFFRPYYSLLPSYSPSSPDCHPSGYLATDWLHDDLAGNGSYCNFQVGLKEGDKDILAMRHGNPEEGVWMAGEHTATFVALGTVTGAYWSGEDVARRVAEGYGRAVGGVKESAV
ncbi:hypothetical protein B0T20DRAFT_362628 [Sordaria brevicollis]|uniref:Amine oxidase domain-containing protein n=1 Tax=Sordaria brevicollis TaxID=83679 RepID=A0AAE0P2L3_SORBR|nr:hypothetical protein B0T20DRAFT_362628 [Sordaria brevicollis]